MTSIYLELGPNSLRRPFRAFRNLDLEPQGSRPGLSCWTSSGSLVSRQKLIRPARCRTASGPSADCFSREFICENRRVSVYPC